MNHWTAQRWAAASGVLFAIVFVAATVIAGEPAGYNVSGAEIGAFLVAKHTELTIQAILSSFEIVLWLWFVSIFARTFRDAGEGWLATIVYGAGVMTLTIGAVGDALLAAVLQLHPMLDDGAVQAIYGLTFFLYLKVFWVLVVLAAASAHATLRSRVLPTWYAYVSLVGAVAFLLGGLAIGKNGVFSPMGAMPVIATLVFTLWVLVSSALLVLKIGAEVAPAATA